MRRSGRRQGSLEGHVKTGEKKVLSLTEWLERTERNIQDWKKVMKKVSGNGVQSLNLGVLTQAVPSMYSNSKRKGEKAYGCKVSWGEGPRVRLFMT